MGSFYPMLENVIFCMNFIIFCTQNRKALADYRMRIPFQMHPTSPRPGAGILPQATEIRSGPGVHPPRRGRVGLRKLALHITFALHLRTSPFLQLGEFSAEFGPVSTLLGNLRGTKIHPTNPESAQKSIQKSFKFPHPFFNGFVMDFGSLLNSIFHVF